MLITTADIPFMDTSNFQTGMAEEGQAILGDYFLGLRVGNEPDLFVVPPVSRTRSHIRLYGS